MRRTWLLLGLCACVEPPRSVTYPQYRPFVASDAWCRINAGVFAFVPQPQLAPSLVGYGCTPPRRTPLPVPAGAGSTFAELVVEPGGAIEIPVQLPRTLQGAGCRLDSVMIPHGKRVSDVAIEIASAGRVVPIVTYEQLPPPREDGVVSRTVSDGSGRRKAIWAPERRASESSLVAIADPELWPTGALLRFDGGRTADGAPSVGFEIEQEPEPAKEEPAKEGEPAQPEEPPVPGALPLPAGGWPAATPSAPAPPSTPPAPDAPAPDSQDAPAGSPEGGEPAVPAPPRRQPATLVLVPYRHRIDIAAPDSFSIVLRAREKAFGIGVRSDRESADPRLSYRAPGAAEAVPTHLVAQVGVIVTRCARPVDEVLRDIK